LRTYTNQYTLFFTLSWAVVYLLHPSWALPISVMGRGFLFFGLIAYFFVYSVLMPRWLHPVALNTPVIVLPDVFLPHIKNAFIMQDVLGSDHCPVGIEIEI